ncbi:PLU-1-like protein-domain-containing protein [Mycena galopus ATCC 62051]|nr:PLU-1-like protein-domain-containing protein [Mycena galopus ATCC 62051]
MWVSITESFNFNEAVNFALPDWLGYGRECVQRYHDHRKLPVFPHDELLITITQQSMLIKTAIWLINSLQEMTDRELRDHRIAWDMGMPEILEEEDRPEDQYQSPELLCERPNDHLTLRKRFPDEELIDTLNQMESVRPPLRSLRAIYSEGKRINYPLPELTSLRKCVNRANEWVDSANSFLIRKQSCKRSRHSRGRPPLNEAPPQPLSDDPGDRPDKGLDELYALLREVETLGFDCPETASLKALAQTVEEMKRRCIALLNSTHNASDRDEFIEECKRVLVDGSSINVLLEELLEAEKIANREQLMRELERKLDENDIPIQLDEVRDLLTRACTCNLPSDNPQIQQLEAR